MKTLELFRPEMQNSYANKH